MGIYLLTTNLIGRIFVGGIHTNELFSSMQIEDYKNFLRLHIDKNGKLTIYPVGVRKVCKRWRFMQDASDGESWFEPEDGDEIVPELLEKPIEINAK